MKKEKSPSPIAAKPEKSEKTVAAKSKAAKPKKSGDTTTQAAAPQSKPKPAAKAVSKPVAAAEGVKMSEQVGLTAGSIWQYLDQNGPTSVAKMVRELPEDEKIIQRSIGWLAKENKITLSIVDRAETITLVS